ncbi:MAG: hypothetical protein Q8N10_03485 [Phenylobacterium sp.]|uniref:hypothetical protein n=1 Tax=Phenylobacterium sp. TaxID=1871053 RepID=UPI002724883E|nr:hypothetical protein [Phenylobacterium sp.]MDO8912333.1 hypothetical protein [Phenylobacterium sp.]MDP3099545.1 hypothetical protein [Phenylobacterium sp.]
MSQQHRIIASEAGQCFAPAHGSIHMLPRARGHLVGHVIAFAAGGLLATLILILERSVG